MAKKKTTKAKTGTYKIRDVANNLIVNNTGGNVPLTQKGGSYTIRSVADDLVKKNQEKIRQEEEKKREEAARKARIYSRVGTDTVLEAGSRITAGVNRQKREDFIRDTLGIKPKMQAEQPKSISGIVSKAGSAVSGQAKREQTISGQLKNLPKMESKIRPLETEELPKKEIEELKRNAAGSKPQGTSKSFREQNIDQAMKDPDSLLNKAARKRIMDDINVSTQAKNLDRILNPVSEEGKGSWLGRQTEEYQNAMALGNAQKNIQAIENLRKQGYLNNGPDVNYYNREKLAMEKIKLNRKKAELDQKIAGYDAELSKYDGRTQQMPDGLQLIMKLGSDEDRRQIANERTILQRYPADSEEYKTAQETLAGIAQKGNQLAQKYLNLNDEYQTMGVMRWTNERLYDAINGDGSYLQAVSEMSLEEKNEFDRAIEEVLPSVERLNKEKERALNRLGDLNDQISRLGKEQEERSRYAELMGTAATGSTEYNDEYYTYQPNTWRRDADNFVNYQTDDIHRIVSFINGGQEYQMWAAGTNGQISSDYSGAMAMMPAEKEKLTALYNQAMQQGKEPTEAKAFFDGLQPYLNERTRRYEELRNQYTARTIPVLSSVADAAMAMTQPFEAIRTGIGLATGQEWAKDPNSWNFANTRAINDIENQVSKDLGDVGGFIYKGAMSGVKNFARGLMAMGTGGAAEAVTLAQFFGENFMSSYQNALEETQDEKYAAKSALVDSAISTFFEVASVEALFGDPKNFVLYMLKNTGAEMSEEYFEAEFGPYIERALMGRSKWDKREGQILNNGGYYDENNKWVSVTEKNAEEAAAQARREQNKEKWEAVGSAAISMIGPAGFGAVRNVMETQQIGQAALQGKSASSMQKEAMQELLRKNALTMIKSGTQMQEGSESRKKAEDLQKDLDSGKKFSKLKYGELVKTIVSETNEQMGKIATEVLQKNIEQDLKDAGAKNPEKMAEIVAKWVTGQELSMPERFALSRSLEGRKAAIEYGYQLPTGRVAEARNEITERTAETRSIQENIRDLLTTEADREKAVNDVEQMMQGAQTAGNITRIMNGTKDSTKVEYDGEVLDVTGFTTGTAEGENGKKEKRIFVQLSNGKEADISEVRGMNENAAKVLRYIQLDGNRMGSNRVANILLQHANDTKDVASMVYDAMKVRINTVLGLNAPRTSGLSAEMTEEIRKAALEDFEEAENERIQNRRQINPGKGRTVYNGVTYGTNAFTEAIKSLNRTQRNEAFAIGVLAKAAGFDVELYSDPTNTKEQGLYTAGGGIRINLAGTANEAGMHRGALATFAHEMTHQLQGNSREAYAQLRQFVINSLQNNGENVETRLRGIMDTYAKNGQELDLNGAVAELVAKSSEQVLTDENVIRQLRESDPNLYGRIRKVVSNLLDRIRMAIGMARETSSYYSKALGNVADELSRLWLGAYQEAKQAAGTAQENRTEQYSKQVDEYKFSDDFEENIKLYVKDKNAFTKKFGDNNLIIGETFKVLRDIGIQNKPMVMNQEHFDRNFGKNADPNHKITPESFIEILRKANDPVAVIRSKSPGMENDSVVVIVDYKLNGHLALIPVKVSTETKANDVQIDINRIASVHSRHNVNGLLMDAVNTELAGKTPGIYYVNKNKVNILRSEGVQFPFVKQGYKFATETKEVMDKIQKSIQDEIDKTTEKQANTILKKNGEIAYVPAKYSFAGEEAQGKYGDDVRRAYRMEKQGATDDEIREATNCIRGFDGRWWKILDNNKMTLKMALDKFKPERAFRLQQIYDAEELAEAYPQVMWAWIQFADLGPFTTGEATPSTMTITISTDQVKRGAEFVEATLQHEIQHLIQAVEFSNRGSSPTFWKEMQDMARARIANNDRVINELYEKYGIDSTRELAFGIEFKEDGSLDEEWLFPEELEKIRKMSQDELKMYQSIEKDSMKWMKVLRSSPDNLYWNTVGEIEARAASIKTDENTRLRYPEDAITTEEYTGQPTSKPGASLNEKDDIDHLFTRKEQFSMQEPVEVNKDGLIAVHNLNEEQLIKTMGLGGFPMPSIAVIKNDYAHNRYGDISVVFYPSAIDPQASRYNKVYGGDAWTPTYPTIEYKLNTKLLDRAMKKIDKLLPADFRTDQVEMYADNLEKSINSARGDMIQAIKDNRRLQLAYLYDRGEEFDIPTREKRLSSGFDNDQIKAVAEALGEDLINEAFNSNVFQYKEDHPEIIQQIVDILNEQWREKTKGIVKKLKALEKGLYDAERFNFSQFDNLINGAYRYFKQGISGETDEYALRDALKERINEEDYINWLHEKFDGLVEKSGVRNNKGYFTNSGTPRSWEALHDEETLENIVNIMRSQNSKGENAFFSQSAMLALGTKDFRSLEDIRKSKGQLQHLTEEEYSAAKENIVNGFSELMDELMDKGDNNPFIARQRALEAMVEAVRKSKTAAGIMKELRQWRGLDLKEDVGQRIAALVKEIGELPTEYFEAKPQRGVGFDEIAKVAIPENASQRLKTMMDQYGIPYETYDGTDEDRLRVLNSVEDAQFSFQDETEMDIGHWMMTVNENALQTEAEKQMLKKYKDLRMRLDLREMRKSEIKNKIARIETTPEAERTEDQKKQLKKLNDQLGHSQRVIDDTLEELARASSEEGFARMMYQESKVLNNFIYGRTQAEVRDAVEAMEKSAETIAQRIAENRESIKELEKSGVVQAVKKVLGRTTVEQAAADLKKAYHSTWTRTELLNYLNPIVLKMTQGEDIEYDVQELAGILLDSDSRNVYEGLSGLRGLTITLGPGQQKELKASNSSLKEVRRRLAGTGIQVKYGDTSTLEADIESLREEYPEMPDFGYEKDALENFLKWVEGMKRSGADADQFYDQKLAEAMATIMQKAASAMNNIYMPTESKAQKQVLALVEFIKSLNAKTEKYEKELEAVAEQMEQMRKAGANATSMVNVLHRDVNIAIDYYNKMAKIAEDNAKQQKQNKIIEQLKSKHAQQILKNNEEWRNLIERDKQARAQAEDNRTTRNKINTVVKRIYNLLKNPQGQKNIPEHMQGLARYLIGMIVDNDMDGRKISNISRNNLEEAKRVLDAWNTQNASFNITDLEAMEDYGDARHIISNDLYVIDEDLKKYNREINGKNKLDTLRQRGQILKEIQEAVSEIYSWIQAEREIAVRDRKILVADAAQDVVDGTEGKKFKEWTGKAGRSLAALHKFIVSGNMTPEYFFLTLGNKGLSELWETYHDAENRNGLELKKAQEKLAAIAEEYGYKNWDTKKKMEIQLSSGKVNMDLGQLMSLWATWKREQTLGPEMSHHLQDGGFYVEEQDLHEGLLGKTELDKKAHRVTEADMDKVASILTDEQKQYVDAVVQYMSNDMSKLGNEASMKAYGINMYKEKYYFPFQIWEGVKSRKSNDAGKGASGNQAFHPSFATLRKNGANNAIILGDFTQTAADHIAGMINYATMGLANENLNKVLNFQVQEGWNPNESTKRNIRAIIDEAYGQEALDYLMKLKVQLEGGAVKVEKTFYDKLISLFRKNAVAGSLSVAMQQPLSYIRAAMMVNPKYLAQALNPIYWKGSYAEMLKHSGVAVIKDMGRFDMNFGQSAREFLMPEAQESNLKRTWEFVKDKATILPEMMDRMTWTRMWSAVKAEQKALHPEMDAKSDEFLNMVGERFNDVMRRTQVYDSVLVKSANMRSENPVMKQFTSFMAEPTLTINVLADAVRQAKNGEKGGKTALAKAGATFLLSAVLQAAVKGLMASGRTPDDKKTWLENFLNRFGSNLMNEADPLQLIPGYSDLITVLKDGKLQDDAMGALGKIFTAGQTGIDMLMGNGDKSPYRMMEDSAGQLIQLFSGLPMKNIMRDMRAMYNFVNEGTYAPRDTSAGVLKYQLKDSIMTADNLFGVINDRLGTAGWETKNSAYYQRIYQAKKEGREQDAQDMIDYLLKGRGVKQTTLNTGISNAAKNDTGASAADTAVFLIEEGGNAEGYIRDQLKDNKMTPAEARKMLKEANPDKDADSIWWTVDRIEYANETGKAVSGNAYYYRLEDAINNNKVDEIRKAVSDLMNHGKTQKQILDKAGDWRSEYLEADSKGKTKIRDAIHKVYQAAGSTVEEADKKVNSWK